MIDKEYKVTITRGELSVSVGINHTDITLEEFAELLRAVSVLAGWTESQVDEIINLNYE